MMENNKKNMDFIKRVKAIYLNDEEVLIALEARDLRLKEMLLSKYRQALEALPDLVMNSMNFQGLRAKATDVKMKRRIVEEAEKFDWNDWKEE